MKSSTGNFGGMGAASELATEIQAALRTKLRSALMFIDEMDPA
jgi:hypothetical protein